MLLSIDKVLHLLVEGKDITDIAKLASCSDKDVRDIIDKARTIINKYEKPISRRKVILKKNQNPSDDKKENSEEIKDILQGAELSAIPVNAALIVNISAYSEKKPIPSGIGILITDKNNNVLGKISASIGIATIHFAEYTALLKALKIIVYFNCKNIQLRLDSKYLYENIINKNNLDDEKLNKMNKKVLELIGKIPKIHIDHITKYYNEKTIFLAEKGVKKDKLNFDSLEI